MLISCISENNKNLEKFCFFIESTIRIQLINLIIENINLRYTHFWEEPINKCFVENGKKFVEKMENGSICKFWLVGIEMEEKTKELNEFIGLEKFSEEIRERIPKIFKNSGNNIQTFYLSQNALLLLD
uniref:Uncharacterized protein n=1 Tax=Meloidogyne enterolobii TaxID=390850 RepID=A0A6V7WEF9_MELEN|nr:unnamed protein product [Meloidogyne enterolobii]